MVFYRKQNLSNYFVNKCKVTLIEVPQRKGVWCNERWETGKTSPNEMMIKLRSERSVRGEDWLSRQWKLALAKCLSERKIGEDGKPRKSVYWKEVSPRKPAQAEAGSRKRPETAGLWRLSSLILGGMWTPAWCLNSVCSSSHPCVHPSTHLSLTIHAVIKTCLVTHLMFVWGTRLNMTA